MKANAATGGWFALAAAGELAGCYTVWAWVRAGQTAWLLIPGVASLVVFAWALTHVDTSYAGRAFAAYGGVYVAPALASLVVIEGARPDRWDLLGVGLCITGTLVIVLAPR